MLTIDDINSINEKHSNGYWHKLEISKIDITTIPSQSNMTYKVDGINILFIDRTTTSGGVDIWVYHTSMKIATRLIYCAYPNGDIVSITPEWWSNYVALYKIDPDEFMENPFDIYIYITNNPTTLPNNVQLYECLFIPSNNKTIIPIIRGEYDDKFYITPLGSSMSAYAIDGVNTTLEEDEKGTFLRLPPYNCIVGTKSPRGTYFPLYKITFKEFKTLPILSIPTVYKGNTQTIQLLDDTEEITEFQAYYKGELLTDNKITLPYDADDYIDITVDLLDNRYPNSTLKLKAPTMMYTANSQSDVETAISQGITTLQVGDTETEVSLNGIDLTNVQLVNSHIQLNNCTLTDCQLIQSTYTDNGANNITDTNFNECEITTTQVSTYNNCAVSECTVTDSELHITGTLNNNTFNNSLIVSDGEITLTNNTFTGIGSKTYFPSHLYLTGDYIVSGNTFNLTGEWETLQFNMCLIKATNDFNVSEFINKNSFNLNITYESEPTNTLYYNIVDDDKIRARRI